MRGGIRARELEGRGQGSRHFHSESNWARIDNDVAARLLAHQLGGRIRSKRQSSFHRVAQERDE